MPIDDAALALAERAASAKGMSLSAWMSQAVRREAVRTGYGPLAASKSASSADAAARKDALTDESEFAEAETDLHAAE